MSALKVTVEPLTVHPHPNADRLELAQVGLYRAVVAKGAFRTGEYALYIPEQAVLPPGLIEELGLTGRLAGKAKNRVKAVRLRGELSQGIVCLPAALADVELADAYAEGTDFADRLGVVKWVPPIPPQMAGEAISGADLLKWVEIENLRRYPGVFAEGEPVVATEKVHGCLHGRVRVLMPDGGHRQISDLVRSNYRGDVLGMNEHGQVVPTRVLATFDNGRTTDWLRVQVSRRGIGRGSASGAVTMTPNHRVYSPAHPRADHEGFVLAGRLTVGDEVWLHRTEVTVPSPARQVSTGAVPGDGSLRVTSNGREAATSVIDRVGPMARAFVRPQKVTAVTPVLNSAQSADRTTSAPRGSTKYDMQTEAGSYFANGMLVHNSCMVLTYVRADDRLLVSSKGMAASGIALKEAPLNLYWRAVHRYGLDQVVRELCLEGDAARAAVYGEVYGAGVQDLHYRADARADVTLGFAAFDLRLDVGGAPSWVDPCLALETLTGHGVPTVPVLYEGPFDLDALLAVADGPTVLGGGAHLREGVVIRPRREGHSEIMGGRKIVKLVSPAYLTRGGDATEFE